MSRQQVEIVSGAQQQIRKWQADEDTVKFIHNQLKIIRDYDGNLTDSKNLRGAGEEPFPS